VSYTGLLTWPSWASLCVVAGLDAAYVLPAFAWRRRPRDVFHAKHRRYRRAGLVQVVTHTPTAVPHPVSAEHPPEDFDG